MLQNYYSKIEITNKCTHDARVRCKVQHRIVFLGNIFKVLIIIFFYLAIFAQRRKRFVGRELVEILY